MAVGQRGWGRFVRGVGQGMGQRWRRWRWVIVACLTLALVVGLYPWPQTGVGSWAKSGWPLLSPLWSAQAQLPPGHESSGNAEDNPDFNFAPTYPMGLPFEEQIAGLDRQDGLFTVYSNLEENKVFLAVRPDQLHRNYMAQATLESGVGEMGLFRGWPIHDLVFQFRPGRNNTLQVVVPNLNVRSPGGTPQQRRLLQGSFSDSLLFGAEVISTDPETGTRLIDLNALLLGQDLVDVFFSLQWGLGVYEPNFQLSGIDSLKIFPENLEIGAELALRFVGGFLSSPGLSPGLQALPDERGFALHLRFSLSQLPGNNGYRPRVADERVGYFLSAFRAPFQVGRGDRFVRYINRWHLEKANPQSPRSRPRQPIVFWIENTVPPEYRAAVREGILAWNSAFEQAGFEQAIEVRQMPDNADWDPADVRYNVVRWSDALNPWALGLGPSRANPLTGQILDADVILDANTIDYLQGEFQQQGLDTAGEVAFYLQSCGQRSQGWYGQWLEIQGQRQARTLGRAPRVRQASRPTLASTRPDRVRPRLPNQSGMLMADHFCAAYAARDQAAFGALALTTLAGVHDDLTQLQEYIRQFIVHLTTHEVGHALGLRHNFAGSLLLDPADLSNPAVIASQGLASSAMDYIPPNVAALGQPQTQFFPTTVGPYDRWAIEYGYRDFGRSHGGQEEANGLAALLRQASTQPELAYVPDEDTWDWIDPEVSPWDLSADPITYATQQLGNARGVWQRLNRWSLLPGEGFGGLRRRVNLVFGQFRSSGYTIANYIGGQRFRRVSPWDEQGRVPLTPIPPEKQRQALETLAQQVFAPDAFQFSPDLLNQLAPNRWWHWGSNLTVFPLDYPIYEQVLMTQSMMLSEVMYSDRLQRLRDGEFRNRDPQRVTLEEVYDTLHRSIWSELRTREGNPQINSLRRGLQRYHLDVLTNQVLRRSIEDAFNANTFMDFMATIITLEAPEDARLLARSELRQLGDEVQQVLQQGDRLDRLTRAHLEAVRDRITQTLNASLRAL